MNGVNAYKDGVISKLHKGLQGLVKSRNVTYVEGSGKLIARDTVEEKILQLQSTKRDLANAIISEDNSLIRDLRREDLELLLS